MEWYARVTSIGMEFALPALLGFGLDRWLHTSPGFTVVGAFLGLGIGMTHVLRLPGELSRPTRETRPTVHPPKSEVVRNDPPDRNLGAVDNRQD